MRTADQAVAKELFAFGLLLLLEIGKLLLHGRGNRRSAGRHGFVRARREPGAVIGVSWLGKCLRAATPRTCCKTPTVDIFLSPPTAAKPDSVLCIVTRARDSDTTIRIKHAISETHVASHSHSRRRAAEVRGLYSLVLSFSSLAAVLIKLSCTLTLSHRLPPPAACLGCGTLQSGAASHERLRRSRLRLGADAALRSHRRATARRTLVDGSVRALRASSHSPHLPPQRD